MKKPLSNQEMYLFVPNLDNVFETNYEEYIQSHLNSICKDYSVDGDNSRNPYSFRKNIVPFLIMSLFPIFWHIHSVYHGHSSWEGILLYLFLILLAVLYMIYNNIIKTKRYIKKYGEEYFRRIVRQTIELCLIRRYFGLFHYSTRHIFENWYSSFVVHSHLISDNSLNFSGRIKSYWNKDKDIKYDIEFKNGNEYGLWKAWYKNGQIAYEQNFKITENTKSGVRHGKARCWNKKGKVIVDLNYIDGKVSF